MRVAFNLSSAQAISVKKEILSWSSDQYISVKDSSESLTLTNSKGNSVTLRGTSLVYEGRRHGLTSPSIESILEAAGFIKWGADGYLHLTHLGRSVPAKVESVRQDAPWYMAGLAPRPVHLVGVAFARARAEGRPVTVYCDDPYPLW